MRKWLRRILLVVLILLLPLAGAGLYLYLNRDALVKEALVTLKRETGALVSVKSADFALISTFPDFALRLQNVVVTDSNIAIHQSPLLTLGQMDLRASLPSLLLGNIRVQSVYLKDGTFTIEQYDDSTSNFLFFDQLAGQSASSDEGKPKADDGPVQLRIKRLVWNNVVFDLNEIAKEKHIKIKMKRVEQRVSTSDSAMHSTFKGSLFVAMLGFNLDKGAFLSNTEMETDFTLRWVAGRKKLVWDGSTFKANGHPFTVDGNVVLTRPTVIDLRIGTRGILEKQVLPLLTGKVSSKVKLYETDGPIDASAVISGPLYPGEDPEVRVNFEGVNQKFTSHLAGETFHLDHFKGYFYNHIDKSQMPGDPNSRIYLSHVEGNWHSFPFVVSGDIRDFDNPYLNGEIHIPLDQKQIELLCQNTPFNPVKSLGWLKAKYSGLVDDLVTAEKGYGINSWKGNALIQVKEGKWRESDLRFEDVDLKCRIRGDALFVDHLSGKLNGNRVLAKGSMKGLASHIGNPSKPVAVHLSASSQSFNLNPLLSGSGEKKPKSTPGSAAEIETVNSYNFGLHLDLKADHVLFRKLDCKDLKCRFDLENNHLKLTDLRFGAGGGEVHLSSAIQDITTQRKKLRSELLLSRVDIKKLLAGMGQFGQNVLRPEHIEGKLDMEGDIAFHLNQNFNPVMETVKGDISFQLRKAKLVRFQPLMDVSGFLLPKESLDEVEIATLSTTFHLKGRNVAMDEMEIPTSLATFYVQGEYDFGDNLDMDILVPIHTISRKNQNEVIKRGAKQKERPSIPVHVYKKNGETKFELDVGRARRRFWRRVKGWTS